MPVIHALLGSLLFLLHSHPYCSDFNAQRVMSKNVSSVNACCLIDFPLTPSTKSASSRFCNLHFHSPNSLCQYISLNFVSIPVTLLFGFYCLLKRSMSECNPPLSLLQRLSALCAKSSALKFRLSLRFTWLPSNSWRRGCVEVCTVIRNLSQTFVWSQIRLQSLSFSQTS